MKKILSFFLVLLGVANAAVFAEEDHSTHSGYKLEANWMGEAQLTSTNVTELVRIVEYATNSRNSGAEPEDVEIFQQDIDNYSLLYNWNNSEEGIAVFILPSGTVISDKKQTKLNRIVNDQKSKTIETISRPESLSNLTPEQVDLLLTHVYHTNYVFAEDWQNVVTNAVVEIDYYNVTFGENPSCDIPFDIGASFSRDCTASWSVTGTVSTEAKIEFAAVVKAAAGINVETSATVSGSATQTVTLSSNVTVPPRTVVYIDAKVVSTIPCYKTETAAFYFNCPECPLHGNGPYTYREDYNYVEGEAIGFKATGFVLRPESMSPCV